jgi:hypothetical protein
MKLLLISLTFISSIFFTLHAKAGTFSDDLSKCIAQSTTTSDRTILAKWLFVSMSLHPSMKSFSTVTEKQLDDSNKEVAHLFEILVTSTCKPQAANAVKYEGTVSLQGAFQVLGQMAAAELFSNPEVRSSMTGIRKYADIKKINAALGITQ